MSKKVKTLGEFIWQDKLIGSVEICENGYAAFQLRINRDLDSKRRNEFKKLARKLKKFANTQRFRSGFYELRRNNLVLLAAWVELENPLNLKELTTELGGQLEILVI